ncbi:putative homing endonuclease protein [Rhizobium phage RHph_I46]|uniref:Putative homing endonuclease protein n=1 Tax=Rhizobium phage RHph_I1_9 TaxID=2509729 RepID=A0A7S5RDM2_9CAUD|nr:HNH endonuclease [Rhizobium phage RHph_I1_9]QIG69679.1 putative homing endonuclease protein [Rhizobium phage RHph_I46]QIG70960.1 putative homing endonuclease protein [Rhizobium phage RHph_I9]QIG73546.1 putative homing endonuclease protein [Rhizobium phage RHph_I1_9]QIG76299.1 putative homing endonuclease protein [Rhizobium phage RHph_I34]
MSSNLFWSKRADKLKSACIYVVTYSGDDMPPFYIGSVYTRRLIEENYHGSVTSGYWAERWHKSVKEHPERFRRKVLFTFDTREEADDFEREFLQHLDAKRLSLCVNRNNNDSNFSGWNKGIPTPEDVKAKMRGPRGKFPNMSESRRGEKNHLHGKKRSKDVYAKTLKKGFLKDPSGRVHFVEGTKEFGRIYGLNYMRISWVLDGKVSQHKGWTLAI